MVFKGWGIVGILIGGLWGGLGGIVARADANPSIQVQGHRGARGNRPENTLPAFDYALALGVDVLELDLVVTGDRQVVVGHDPVLNPQICLDFDGKPLTRRVQVSELTLSELKRFDCGTLKHPRFPGQEPVPGTLMPTLGEFFQFLEESPRPKARTVALNIELKVDPEHPEWTVDRRLFVDLVLELIARYGVRDRVNLQSFDFETLQVVRAADATLVTAYLTETSQEDRIARTLACGASILSADFDLLTEQEVQRARTAGLKVIPWTLNQEAEWKRAVVWGVDGIITDYPGELLKFLGR
jgi:glycerophosphoryl diester phosphodiesterase